MSCSRDKLTSTSANADFKAAALVNVMRGGDTVGLDSVGRPTSSHWLNARVNGRYGEYAGAAGGTVPVSFR